MIKVFSSKTVLYFNMRTFEYKTVLVCGKGFFSATKKLDIGKIDKTLNQLGKDGWELVTSKVATKGWGLDDGLLCIFKRCVTTNQLRGHLKLAEKR